MTYKPADIVSTHPTKQDTLAVGQHGLHESHGIKRMDMAPRPCTCDAEAAAAGTALDALGSHCYPCTVSENHMAH
eukprot:365870-Chlamydomonas_euryale.AAC.6